MSATSTKRLRKCSNQGIREAIGYLTDEAAMFPELLDTPVYKACRMWLRAELRRRRSSSPKGSDGAR